MIAIEAFQPNKYHLNVIIRSQQRRKALAILPLSNMLILCDFNAKTLKNLAKDSSSNNEHLL